MLLQGHQGEHADPLKGQPEETEACLPESSFLSLSPVLLRSDLPQILSGGFLLLHTLLNQLSGGGQGQQLPHQSLQDLQLLS